MNLSNSAFFCPHITRHPILLNRPLVSFLFLPSFYSGITVFVQGGPGGKLNGRSVGVGLCVIEMKERGW